MLTEFILIGLLLVLSAILYVSCAKNDFESLDLGNLNKPQQEQPYRIPAASHLSFSYKGTSKGEEKKAFAFLLSHYVKKHPNENLLTPPYTRGSNIQIHSKSALSSHLESEPEMDSNTEEKKSLAPAITDAPPNLGISPLQIVK